MKLSEKKEIIKANVTISDLLHYYGIQSDKHGRIPCPFHIGNNRNAFSYSDKKQLFQCFNCGVRGDQISFVMAYEDLPFVDAINRIGEIFSLFSVDTVLNKEQVAKLKKMAYNRKQAAKKAKYDEQVYENLRLRVAEADAIITLSEPFSEESRKACMDLVIANAELECRTKEGVYG